MAHGHLVLGNAVTEVIMALLKFDVACNCFPQQPALYKYTLHKFGT